MAYLESLKKQLETGIDKLLNGRGIAELTDDEMNAYLDLENKLAEIDTFQNHINDLIDSDTLTAEHDRIKGISQKRREFKLKDSAKVTTLAPGKKLMGTLGLTKVTVGKDGVREVVGERDELLKEIITLKALIKSGTLSLDEENIARSLEYKLNAKLQRLYSDKELDAKSKAPDGKNPDGKDPDGKDPDGKDLDGKDPDGKGSDGKDLDGKDPDGKDPNGTKSPRHWVEIMAETQTQSAGSITTAFHKVGKIQPFRMGLTIWMAPMKLAMKGAGKLFGDVLGRAESKKREMVENVRGLSDEEFEILVNGLTETNMRQYKVNEIYLDAVQEVLEERENAKKQVAINDDNVIKSALAQTEDRMKKIDKELQDPAILPDRKLELESEKAKCSITYSVLNMQHNVAYNREMEADKRMTDFDRGKVGKSTRKMNIQGWLAGSFNPDNREVHREEAKFRKEAREAADRGDTVAVVEAQRKIDEIQEENTNVIQFLEGTRFESRARINRGKHTVEEVHSRANDADQTKGRELMATAMAAVTFANMYKTWQANQDMQQQVDAHLNQHNQEVRNVNAQNQQVQQSIDNANAHNSQLGQDISATKSSVSSQEINQAGIGEIHRNNAATYSVRHEAEFVRDNTPGIGFNHGGSDEAIHAAQAGMTQARQNAENGGFASIQQEVQASAARVQDAAKDVLPDIQGFTSIAGKSGYINSEYVTNLQSIVNGSPDSFTLLSNLFSSVQKLGDPAQVVGTIGDVSEIAPLVLSTNSGTMMNILPFVTAMANATHLEVQKSKMNLERQRQEQREKQAQKEAKKDEPEKNIDDNDGR